MEWAKWIEERGADLAPALNGMQRVTDALDFTIKDEDLVSVDARSVRDRIRKEGDLAKRNISRTAQYLGKRKLGIFPEVAVEVIHEDGSSSLDTMRLVWFRHTDPIAKIDGFLFIDPKDGNIHACPLVETDELGGTDRVRWTVDAEGKSTQEINPLQYRNVEPFAIQALAVALTPAVTPA